MEFTFSYTLMIITDNPQSLAWHMRIAALLRELFMFLVGSGVYTLEMRAFPGSTPGDGEVHIFPAIAVPLLVRLDPRYFYSRHTQIKHHFPALLLKWLREHERLTVIRHTLADLLTVDGISPEAIFMRVVQTMEHFHGLVFPGQDRYVSRQVWRRFTRWLDSGFPAHWREGEPSEHDELIRAKLPLMGRINGINSLSFHTRIRALFDAVPGRELTPLIDNPRDATEYLNTFVSRIAATRHYLTHFSSDQRELAFPAGQLEVPTLQCWSVLIFTLARYLGLRDELAGDIALSARNTMFLIGTKTQL